jgi:sugar phosphate isomerase/epimerase
MSITRRDLLKLGAGTAAVLATGSARVLAQAAPTTQQEKKVAKKIPVGLQLWSVRDDCAKDLPGTLKAIAAMGYQGVEWAGYHNRKAEELRKLIDDLGLKTCGTHTGLDTLTGDAFKATVEFNKVLGNKFLIVPSLPADKMGSEATLKEVAKLLSELADKAKELDMRVGYHAHGPDFKRLGDTGPTAWDVIFSNAAPGVLMQLDTGNCLEGGGDPVAVLKKYPHRSLTIHLKEHGGPKGTVVGSGDVPWKDIFATCESTGDTEWYIVEQEVYTGTPLDSVKECMAGLKKLGKV